MAVRDDLISMSSTYRRMLGLKIDNSGSNGFRTSPGIVGVKPGRKWWRFPGENPGENGSVHACRSMMLEDGADAPLSPALSRYPEVRRDMENWKEIRQRILMNGLSQRAACEKYQLGWQTLKKILAHTEVPERLHDHAQIYGVMAAEFSLLTLVVGQSSSRVCRSAAKHSSVQSLYGGIRRNVPNTAKTQGFSSLNASPCKRHGSM